MIPYPLTWRLFIDRNPPLRGDINDGGTAAADARALEQQHRDEGHVLAYAEIAQCSIEQANRLLNAFFESTITPQTAPWTFHVMDPATYRRPKSKRPGW